MFQQSREFRHALAVGLLCCSAVAIAQPATAAGTEALDPERTYAITYEVSAFEVQTIKPAHVLGVMTIGTKAFLIIDVGGPQKSLGYVELERVRAILPTPGPFSLERERDPSHGPLIQ